MSTDVRRKLAILAVAVRRARPFVVTADDVSSPTRDLDRLDLRARLVPAKQLGLFEAHAAAATGEL